MDIMSINKHKNTLVRYGEAVPSQNVNYDASALASAPGVSRIGKCNTVALRPRTIAATHMAS